MATPLPLRAPELQARLQQGILHLLISKVAERVHVFSQYP